MEAQWNASALISQLMNVQILVKLYQKGLLNADDVRDVYDQLLLNVETHQAIAGADEEVALAARSQLEMMIGNLRTALPPAST